jgi:hypothetical protein
VSAIHSCAIESENPHFVRELSIYDDAKKEMPNIDTGLLRHVIHEFIKTFYAPLPSIRLVHRTDFQCQRELGLRSNQSAH